MRIKGVNMYKARVKVKVKSLSCVRLFVTPWTVAYQAPLFMGFSRQQYWSGLPFPSPKDLPFEPRDRTRVSRIIDNTLPSEPPGKSIKNEVAQSCPTLCDPMDCSLPGSSVHGIFQAIVVEWIAISFSKGSPESTYGETMGTVRDFFFGWGAS